jgi:hypothetical protein
MNEVATAWVFPMRLVRVHGFGHVVTLCRSSPPPAARSLVLSHSAVGPATTSPNDPVSVS